MSLFVELQQHDTFLHHMETQKKAEPQMGFKPMTLSDLVRCTNY